MTRVLVYGLAADKLGGIETFVLNMNNFMPSNVVFDYVIEGESTIHEQAISELGGKVYYIKPKRDMLGNVLDWRTLLKSVKGSVDTVYFNMYSLSWIPPVLMSQKMGFKTVVHAHNNKLHTDGVLLAMHNAGRKVLAKKDIVRLTNSELSAEFFFLGQEADLIYNAIDVDRFTFDEKKRREKRAELGVGENQHLYLFVGRIAAQKNPLFLMEVFSEIQKLDSLAEFVVVGEGDLLDEARTRAEELGVDVRFVGSKKDIENYYFASDCLVQPSLFEGLGITLIEAQCSGLPCVTSKDVVPEIAKVTELLHFVPLPSPASFWANCCYELIDSSNQRDSWLDAMICSRFEIVEEGNRLSSLLVGR